VSDEARRRRDVSVKRAAAVIESLCAEGLTLAQVAEKHGLSLPRLTRWAMEPEAQAMLATLRGLCESRTALVSAQARIDAAHALRRLAMDEESKETARKACVDLLKLEPAREEGPAKQGESAPAPPESHDAVRALLERLAGVVEEPGP